MPENVTIDTSVAQNISSALKKADFKNISAFKKVQHDWDSVQNAIINLQRDSLALAKDVESLKSENATLLAKKNQLEATRDNLNEMLQHHSIINDLTPSACAMILLIIMLTFIVLWKKISFLKKIIFSVIGKNKETVGKK